MQTQKSLLPISDCTASFFAEETLQHHPVLNHHSIICAISSEVNIELINNRIRVLEKTLSLESISLDFWHDKIEGSRGSIIASDICERERFRLVSPCQTVRIVLLTYICGSADIIITARKGQINFVGLNSLAQFLSDGKSIKNFANKPKNAILTPFSIPQLLLDWGNGKEEQCGETGSITVSDDFSYHEDIVERITAATGFLLSFYGTENPQLALLKSSLDRDMELFEVKFSARRDDSLGKFIADARNQNIVSFPTQDGAMPTVGIVVTNISSKTIYTPCFEALFPFTQVWNIDENRRIHGQLLFDKGVISQQVAEQFLALMAQFLNNFDNKYLEEPASNLVQMSEIEQRNILETGKSNLDFKFSKGTITDAFIEIVRTQSEHIAVSDNKESLSYRELNERADLLAMSLRSIGVKPGEKVGICLSRNVGLIVSLLAVLKVGAAYVPMDEKYPQERLIYTVKDAGLNLVITDALDFPAIGDVNIYSPELILSHQKEVQASDVIAPDNLAYVIYTSGSTGKPKGVAIPHQNVINLLSATKNSMNISNKDTWTLFHSSAFDFSVWEIWGCLLSGGHLVVVPYWTTRTPEDFYKLLVERGVTILSQTPSAFVALQEVDKRYHAKLLLRLVIFGGESLNMKILANWVRHHPLSSCRLVNMFGITETTVHVTQKIITTEMIKAGSRSVGLPLPSWSISVRNNLGMVLPYGIQGEIWVGGESLASHYLNEPELTKSHFVVDEISGERMYKSGDLGRIQSDGTLEHLGRIDSQVKVRGFRIELGEIQQVLLDSPQVAGAAVLLSQSNDNANVQIEAYVVLAEGTTIANVRDYVVKYLPDYMIPGSFKVVSHIPLTSNGKLAASELPNLLVTTPEQLAVDVSITVDCDPFLQLWRNTLGKDISLNEDFFESGGNSLLAVRLCGAIREGGLGDVSLRDLYMYPTPTELQTYLQNCKVES